MYTSIVVPLDGSVFGNGALPVAVTMAQRSDAFLHLVHVREPIAFPYGELPAAQADSNSEEKVRSELTRVAAHLAREGALRVDAEFLVGDIETTLRRYFEDARHDLAVMMTHGRGRLSRSLLGSVADALVRHSPVPLLLLHQDTAWLRAAAEPLFRRVLIPLDGSAMAETILDHVFTMGTPDATEYVILSVVAPHRELEAADAQTDVITGRSFDERQRDAAREYLHGVAASLRDSGAQVTTRVEVHQETAQGILDAALEYHVDLIALSTHGRGGMSRFLHGSVADKVLREASAPILVCRPHETPVRSADTGDTTARTGHHNA